jgi:hypothetical protein
MQFRGKLQEAAGIAPWAELSFALYASIDVKWLTTAFCRVGTAELPYPD